MKTPFFNLPSKSPAASYIMSSVLALKEYWISNVNTLTCFTVIAVQKRPFQVSEKHNGFVDAVVHHFLYAHPPNASFSQSIQSSALNTVIGL